MTDGPTDLTELGTIYATATRRIAAMSADDAQLPVDEYPLPMSTLEIAGLTDHERVERWARRLCNEDGIGPDNSHPENGTPWWHSFKRTARSMMALADEEAAAIRHSACRDGYVAKPAAHPTA